MALTQTEKSTNPPVSHQDPTPLETMTIHWLNSPQQRLNHTMCKLIFPLQILSFCKTKDLKTSLVFCFADALIVTNQILSHASKFKLKNKIVFCILI